MKNSFNFSYFAFAVVLGIAALGGSALIARAQLSNPVGNSTPEIQNTLPFISPGSFISRLGSLAIGHSSTPSYWRISGGQGGQNSLVGRCLIYNPTNPEDFATKAQSCLDVNGSAVFPRLVVRTPAQVGGLVAVGTGSGSGGGSFESYDSSFIIKGDVGSSVHSMLLSSLAWWSGITYAPQNTTRQRKVCSDQTGKIVLCPRSSGGGGLGSEQG